MAIISPATGDKICDKLKICLLTLHLPVAGSSDEAEKTWESRQQQEVDAGQKDELIKNQRWRDCENCDWLDMVGVGASMNLHRGALYICTNLKNIIAKHIKLP